MALQRRTLLTSLAAAGAALAWSASRADGAAADLPAPARFLSAGSGITDTHHVAGLDADGRLLFAHAVPERGHAVNISPDRRTAVMCARRAGRFAVVVDLATGGIVRQIDSARDRHFYGHAVFSADGTRLFATENDYAAGEGRIGIYDADDGFRRVGEWSSHGIGPHEIRISADGTTLAIANGGILTHPDTGREKLNLDTMAPSLVLIDAMTGALVRKVGMPSDLHQLSMRHLALGRDGSIVVVLQYEGPEGDMPPLVGSVDRQGRLQLLSAPEPVQMRMANYCGSVAFDHSGRFYAVSAPRGGLITFWSEDGTFVASAAVADGCGVAADGQPGGFMISSGLGGLWRYDLARQSLTPVSPAQAPIARWDNHLATI